MSEETFKNIIKNTYNFEDEDKKCEICEEPIGDFDDNGIYEGKYCEYCFSEAQEGRLK